MSGTRSGGKLTAKTNKHLYGKNFYVNIGAKGGAKKNPDKGFGTNRELARIAGAKGGKKSRRTK